MTTFFKTETALRRDAHRIIERTLQKIDPSEAVKRVLREALGKRPLGSGRVVLIAVGKAAWTMAKAALEVAKLRAPDRGIVITKYGHSRGPLEGIEIYEAGHPVPDEHSYRATKAAVEAVSGLCAEDTVIFLLSGGGSALFEMPLIPLEELEALNRALLRSGADIAQINTLRKRFSAVKGGRFGAMCAPARVVQIVLSDVVGDRLDLIASGPAVPDRAGSAEALEIAEKYQLKLTPKMRALLEEPLPERLPHVETYLAGGVSVLLEGARQAAEELGYKTTVLTDSMAGEAREEGKRLGAYARLAEGPLREKQAFLAAGETIVRVKGKGLGGRNQELALSAAKAISQREACLFSLGSDGTDGPTEAAGGIVDSKTYERLLEKGIDPDQALEENDAYHALLEVDGLIMTGPTGTNINDVAVLLLR